jgi:hypothetical protein
MARKGPAAMVGDITTDIEALATPPPARHLDDAFLDKHGEVVLDPVIRAMQVQAEQHADPAPARSAPFDHEAALASIITKNREVDAARAVHKRRAEDTKSAKQVLDDLSTQLSEMIAEFGKRLDGTDQPTLFDAAAHVNVDGNA